MTNELIEKLNKSENPEERIKLADQILEDVPFLLEPYFEKGFALYELERYDEAIKTFNESFKFDVHMMAARTSNNGLGLCYAAKGDYKRALRHFNKTYKIDKKNENVILNIAVMHEQLNEPKKALKKYEEILKINPDNNFAEYKVNMLSVNPDFENIQDGIEKANLCYQMKKYDEALKIDEQILKIQSDCVPAFHNQGLCYTELGLMDKALEAYENVLKINPNALHALNNMGLIYIKLEEFEKAREVLERNIKAYPDDELAYANNAFALLQLKEYEKSIEMGKKSLEINPNQAEVYNNLAWCYEASNDFTKSLECYDKGIEINPNHSPLYNNKAWSLRQIKEFDDALKCYDKAIELDGENALYLKNIAATYKEMSDLDKAHEYYAQAFNLDSSIESFDEL